MSSGYKYGFITSSSADKYIYKNNNDADRNGSYSNISNGTYYLHSAVASNKSLDVSGKDSASGENVHVWERNNTDAQKFKIEKLSNGAYKILTFCGKSLDIENFSNRDGANVLQWDYHGGTNQQWRFISAGNGYYYIKSALGKYLDVSGGSSANGTNVQVWTGNSTNAQRWKLERMNGAVPTPVPQSKVNLSYGLYKNNSAYISCYFDGYKNVKGRHEGIDIVRYNGAPIYALVSGTVINVKTGKNGANGLSTIAIYDSSANKTVVYLHANPMNVWKNKYVNKGDQIGTQGWRGISRQSSSHTHVEVRNGKRTSAAKSVGDYTLDNPNPTSYWNSKGYNIK